jgi:hypothetical protein
MTCVVAILDFDLRQINEGSAITQEMLERYQTLCVYEAEKRELRRRIQNALDAGAEIEEGPLTARQSTYPRIVLSFDKVVEVLGAAITARLRSDIAPTECRSLYVERTNENHRRRRRQRR